MKLSPRELLHFAELWSLLQARPKRVAALLEGEITRKRRKVRRRRDKES